MTEDDKNDAMKINRFPEQTAMALAAAIICLTLLSSVNLLYAGEAGKTDFINCQMHDGECKQALPDCEVTLDIRPKPVKAMTDLLFHVSISGSKPESPPYIDLGMPGMKMGPNRVKMKPVGKNAYEGRGIIVRCPSGRRTWSAKVTVPGLGVAEFVFNVVY